ncbi:MAG TPA: type II secretion system F family protein [Phycisphaerales bacterium]|nr:type II secretion system F family protein [Phycisphaerales bacterium]
MSRAATPTQFVYLATRMDGGYRLGTVRGRDVRQATAQLRRQRLMPVRTWALPAWASGESALIPLKDQGEVHMQLAQLTGRGVPLVEALDVVSTSVAKGTRQRVARVRELVASGGSFSASALASGLFDQITCAVYSAAERSGDIPGAAKQLASTTRRQLATQGKVATLLIYPVILGLMSVAASVFLLVSVVPKVGRTLEEQLAGAGRQLPIYTRVLMAAGEFITDHWGILLGVVCAIAIAGVAGRALVGKWVEVLVRTTPLLRDVALTQESARFFTVMAAMTRTGIPLADALGVAGSSLRHPLLRTQIMNLRTRLIEGGVLRQLIDTVTALPVSTRRLMIAAERSGDLGQAFDTLSGDLEQELDRRTSRFLAVLEPGLIIMMAALIGGMLLSVLIPMLTVASQIGG